MTISHTYDQYFGLRENPFSITPDPRFVYLSDIHREALDHLVNGAMYGTSGFVLLTGDVGTGKTTLCRAFLEQLPPKTEVVLILNPVLTLNEFLQTICDELDLVIEGSRKSNKNLIDHLNRFLLQVYAVGHKTILIVDEAQNLSHELLEQIRLLTNLESNTAKLLQIFLIGQPELRQTLKRPELLQVSQRITSRYHLGPLNKAQTREYIQKRLSVAGAKNLEFTASAIRRIYNYSKGVPRLINIVCDKALLSAYRQSTHRVDGKIVRDAERLLDGTSSKTQGSFFRTAAIGAASAVMLIAGLVAAGYLWNVAGLRDWLDGGLAEARRLDVGAQEELSPSTDPRLPGSTTPPGAQASEHSLADDTAARPSAEATDIPAGVSGFDDQAGSEVNQETSARAAVPATARPLDEDAGLASDTAQKVRAPESDSESPPEVPSSLSPDQQATGGWTERSEAAAVDQSLADYTRRYAERKLLAMWGVTGAQQSGLDFCRDVLQYGLNCLSESSGLPGLLRYDRPAILYLDIAEVPAYAVLLKASRDRVVLDVLDREHVIPADSLGEVWDGRFLLLWRRGNEINGNIVLGAQGQAAVWLRRAMDKIEGIDTSGSVYDEQLVARVKRFQSEVGLIPDGIVGPRTLILLQNRLAETGS